MAIDENGKSFKNVLLGALFTACFTALGWSWSTNDKKIETIAATQQLRGERLAKAEAEIRALEQQLTRIETKLDLVLEERRSSDRSRPR